MLLSLLILAACQADLSAPASDSGLPAVQSCVSCVLSDGQNFRYTADLDVVVLPVQAGADVQVDWSELSTDIQGHAVDPVRDLEGARLVAFPELSPEEVAAGLVGETLLQEDLAVYMSCQPDQPTCALSDFSVLGSSLDLAEYFTQGSASWLVSLTPRDELGAASMIFLEPLDDAVATEARIDDDSAQLSLDVDLLSLEPLVVPAGQRALDLDWSGLTHDGLGQSADARRLDLLELARFDASAEQLQDQLFDLELLATDWWQLSVPTAQAASLDALSDDFQGLDTDGTWLLALRCSTCDNPMPRFLTVLQVQQ